MEQIKNFRILHNFQLAAGLNKLGVCEQYIPYAEFGNQLGKSQELQELFRGVVLHLPFSALSFLQAISE